MKGIHSWGVPVGLFFICVLAFIVRCFSVITYESMIHEYDPQFNVGSTQYLLQHGLRRFFDWFDETAWHPYGRDIGATIWPGIMLTAVFLHRSLHLVGLPLHIRDICVFMGPLFACLSCLSLYELTRICTRKRAAGMFAALFLAINPAYLSRSTAGAFDNEAVAIFAIIFSIHMYIHALQAPSISRLMVAIIAFAYLLITWGGYTVVSNFIALYHIYLLAMRRGNKADALIYLGWYSVTTLIALNVPVIAWQAICSGEHLALHCTAVCMVCYVISEKYAEEVAKNRRLICGSAALGVLLLGIGIGCMDATTIFTGRVRSLLIPTQNGSAHPLIASISEHRQPVWITWYTFGGRISLFTSLGLIFALAKPQTKFEPLIGLIALGTMYFGAIMVRLLVVLAPFAAAVSGRACAELIREIREIHGVSEKSKYVWPLPLLGLLSSIFLAVNAGVYYASYHYSNPTVVTRFLVQGGGVLTLDDTREAYQWINRNTPKDSRILAWWDYGYQTTFLADRSVLVDNNTWQWKHIARVGAALTLDEKSSAELMRAMDVDYVFVTYGGFSQQPTDDFNKLPSIAKIAHHDFSEVPSQKDLYNASGRMAIGKDVSDATRNSLLFKLSVNGFPNNLHSRGYDFLRKDRVTEKFILEEFEEVYTTTNWSIRIYKVKPRNRRSNIGLRVKLLETL